jgi:2-isopropylmalate synthase
MSRSQDRIIVFDTTLRDGEQSPGASMDVHEKVLVAKQLEMLGVDKIEAGFPISSPGDFDAVQAIAGEIEKSSVVGLARAKDDDINAAWEAVKDARKPCVHTFIATSDIHLKYQLRMSRQEVLKAVEHSVGLSASLCSDVEFSAMDATRSDWDYLADIYTAAIESGARTINVPDTVGYATPQEMHDLITHLKKKVKGIQDTIISVHCHNDLGLAVANTVSAVMAGARQVECTINGIGERAGNTSLEEVVMIFNVRKDFYGAAPSIDTTLLYPTSRLVSHITGMPVQPNKAIVGANAFAHEAGIHQDGYLKERSTYEIMTPEAVGFGMSRLVLGKHSGKHALSKRLEALGYHLDEKDLRKVFRRFKEIADKKREIFDEDIEAIVLEEIYRVPARYELKNIVVSSGTVVVPTATVQLAIDNKVVQEAGFGNGPVDALYKTIIQMAGFDAELKSFTINAITGGTDAQGEVTIELADKGSTAVGQGSDPDILVACAKALVNAMNRMEFLKGRKAVKGPSL